MYHEVSYAKLKRQSSIYIYNLVETTILRS